MCNTRYLDGNTFSALDESIFSDLASLQQLSITGCALGSLPDGIFSGLGALKGLYLRDNDLGILSAGLLGDDLVALERLDLRQNSLATIPTSAFQSLPALTTLDLSGNELSTLAPSVFPGTLRQLYLTDNELGQGALDPGTFGGLGKVETLTLTNNGLGSLPAGLFDGLASLTVLGLAGNDGLQCLPSTADSPSLADDKLILPSGFSAAAGVCPCPGADVCDDCVPGVQGYVCTGCGEEARLCNSNRTCRECRIPASNDEEEAKWEACLGRYARYEATDPCSFLSATACCFDELSANDCVGDDDFVEYSTCVVQAVSLAQAVSQEGCASLSCQDAESIFATDDGPDMSGGRRPKTGLTYVVGASVAGTGISVAAGMVMGL